MKHLLTLALLCTTLFTRAAIRPDAWNDIDTLLAQGHYATAYDACSHLIKKARRTRDSHALLVATYKQRTAAEAYQENATEGTLEAYRQLLPHLKGADKAIAHLLIAPMTSDRRPHYEAALAESQALKAIPADAYDLLIAGDSFALRLRPTLYDVVIHSITDDLYLGTGECRILSELRHALLGTAAEFAALTLPADTTSLALWQLRQLQVLTQHHLHTPDAAVRAHIDRKRMEKLKHFAQLHTDDSSPTSLYAAGLERIADSYLQHPDEQAMMLYLLAEHHAPQINPYTDSSRVARELAKAAHMEHCIQRITHIAPHSEWATLARTLQQSVTHPYLSLQSHTTLLPGRDSHITLTVRNTADIAYRIVPRYAGETTDRFTYEEVIRRRSVGTPYQQIHIDLPNTYIYKEAPLALPALEAGDYFVIATNNGATRGTKRSSITAISVSGLKLAMMLNEAEGEYIGMVIDATTGRAVTDCELTLMENSGQSTRFVEQYFTDAQGYFTVPLPEGRYRNLYLRATDGHSHATYTFRYADFAEHRYWSRPTDESPRFSILPDRYTYAPGDTVHCNLIAYSHSDEGSRVLSHRPISLTFTDARRKQLATLRGTTDAWGCYSTSFVLPPDVTPGSLHLQATDSISQSATAHTLNVEAFKAPTFTIDLERPTGIVRFGDSLTLQGTATTYTGLPVAHAKVEYKLLVTDMNIFGRYPLPDAYLYESAGTTTTDAQGRFALPIQVHHTADTGENATCNHIIEVTITDPSGETRQSSTHFIVGHRTKHTDLPLWRGTVMHGDTLSYRLLTLGGEPLAEPVTLRLSQLKVPHHTGIRTSDESDWEQWSEARTLIDRTEQSAIAGSRLPLTPDMPCGIYRLTLTYTDGGKRYTEHCHFKLWGEGKGTEPSYVLYNLTTDLFGVDTGDTAVFYIGTRHTQVHTHYYIKVQDRVVGKGTLLLTDETRTLRIPVDPAWRGTLTLHTASVKDNVTRTCQRSLPIHDRASRLYLQFAPLPHTLTPGHTAQGTVQVTDHLGRPVQTALTLSIYDAALDTYGTNQWNIPFPSERNGRTVEIDEDKRAAWDDNTYIGRPRIAQPSYYTLPMSIVDARLYYSLPTNSRLLSKGYAVVSESATEDAAILSGTINEAVPQSAAAPESAPTSADTGLRERLHHTALFLPALRTDAQGRATFSFTAPDLLTRWHVKALAHTKQLQYGHTDTQFVTRKELMVQPYVPRFLYEGDTCRFAAKVTNSSDRPIEATVTFEAGSYPTRTLLSLAPHSSATVSFPLTVPLGTTLLTYRISAQGATLSDGEQGTLTVLPRRTLVTETLALYTNGKEKRDYTLASLHGNRSATLEHHRLTLDLVSNPLWYAIEALPPLSREQNPTCEQLFHRYYATTLALQLLQHYPTIGEQPALAPFYQADSLSHLQQQLHAKLLAARHPDGGWAWMEGFPADRYTTLLIIKGIGELESMGCLSVAQDDALYEAVKQGLAHLDRSYHEHFEQLSHKPRTLDSYALYYLYARSLFPELPVTAAPATAYEHYRTLLLKSKAKDGTLQHKALKMLTLQRMGQHDLARKVAKATDESALESDEMGIYWRDNRYAYSWDANPIATQALLIEAYARLQQPAGRIARMQQWLLKQKQTTHWESSIATAQAVHALLTAPTGTPATALAPTPVSLHVGGKELHTQPQSHLGLIQHEWAPEEIRPALAKVSIQSSGDTPTWGALTWQYYEEAPKVSSSGTGLTLTVEHYKVEHSAQGETLVPITPGTPLAKGDRVRTRVHFTADRAMDYVELHLPRPAALEPVSTRSGYIHARGLAHYRSITNTRTSCYLYRVDKGSYQLDFDAWVSLSGHFTSAPSTIQCMYAPAFIATAASTPLQVE